MEAGDLVRCCQAEIIETLDGVPGGADAVELPTPDDVVAASDESVERRNTIGWGSMRDAGNVGLLACGAEAAELHNAGSGNARVVRSYHDIQVGQ